jgi:hypothetical protein
MFVSFNSNTMGVTCGARNSSLVVWYLFGTVLSVFLRLTASDYWPSCRVVCISSIDGFWLLAIMSCCLYFFDWRLLIIGHHVVFSVLLRLTASDYWPLCRVVCTSSIDGFWLLAIMSCCLYFFDWRLLIIGHHVVWYVLLRLTASDYPFGIFKLFLFHDMSLIYSNKHDSLCKKNY